jgi:hypothetical protein
VELEWQGIPSATLVHEALTGSAEAICRVSGMTGYPFITVGYPHVPTAVWSDEEIAKIAKQVAPQVKALLTRATGTAPSGPIAS